MMINIQRPLHFHGFGIAVLKLDTFTTVREFGNEEMKGSSKIEDHEFSTDRNESYLSIVSRTALCSNILKLFYQNWF